MKKKLNIIVLLTLVVLTLFTFGCKKEVEAGEEVRGWNIYAQDGACGDQVVTLKVEKGDITWFCWTLHQADGGYIQTAGKDYKIYKYVSGDDHFGEEVNNITTLENGNTYIFKFGVKGNYDLYIHQPEAEKSAGGTKDFRGKVKVEGNTVHLKDSGYKDITGKNVEVYIENDEPIDGAGGSLWQGGNYVITELWPLIPTQQNEDGSWKIEKGSVWSVNQSLKYTNLSLSKSYSAGWLFPMEEGKPMIIAMYQPKRSEGATRPSSVDQEKLDEKGCATVDEYLEMNLNSVFGKKFEYTDNRKYNNGIAEGSNSFGEKQFVKSEQVFTAKSAFGTIDYYTVSDVPEGMTK